DAQNLTNGMAVLWTTTLSPQTITLGFANFTTSVLESAGVVTATVRLTTSDGAPTASAGSVSYATSDDTAKAGSDYVATSGSLSWQAGTASGTTWTIDVPIVNDNIGEADEFFQIALGTPFGAMLGQRTYAVKILNDDSLPALRIGDWRAAEGNDGT